MGNKGSRSVARTEREHLMSKTKIIARYQCAGVESLPPKQRKRFYKKMTKVLAKFLGKKVLVIPSGVKLQLVVVSDA